VSRTTPGSTRTEAAKRRMAIEAAKKGTHQIHTQPGVVHTCRVVAIRGARTTFEVVEGQHHGYPIGTIWSTDSPWVLKAVLSGAWRDNNPYT